MTSTIWLLIFGFIYLAYTATIFGAGVAYEKLRDRNPRI
jgi:hypothetical protein